MNILKLMLSWLQYNVKSSGVYTIANFCGVKCSNTRVIMYSYQSQLETEILLTNFKNENKRVHSYVYKLTCTYIIGGRNGGPGGHGPSQASP